MGIDIGLFVEVKEDGVWKSADEWVKYYKSWQVKNPFYNGRNYTLFKVLGFSYDEEIIPISDPKGIPKDLSEELKEKLIDSYIFSDCYYKCHSYLTLKELQDYLWELEFEGKSLKEICNNFLTFTIPRLQKLNKNPEDVRIVFAFD